LRHLASSRFWALYHALPADVRQIADKNFTLVKSDPRHPSLHFKRIGELWSVRVGDRYRALGTDVDDGNAGSGSAPMRSTTRSSAKLSLEGLRAKGSGHRLALNR